MKKPSEVRKLGTEQRNTASAALDTKSALQIAQIINAEDTRVATAITRVLTQIAKAIDAVADAIANDGRLIYVGAGTSGRIAALDASECPPTFNTDPQTVQYVMAGGEKALAAAAEFNEDSRKDGVRDISAKTPSSKDVVAGLAASGRTPYTIAAVEYAKSRGAKTVAIVCNKQSELGQVADIEIAVDVGPEVLSGSTRMKAGTAQKLVCNMITTGAMTRLGYVYGNLMVNVNPSNEKLVQRALNILEEAAEVDIETAREAFEAAGRRVPVALVMLKRNVDMSEAQRLLAASQGNVRKAIESKV